MKFYQELSRYYDEIFAVGDAEMRFIATLLEARSDILDIGCGTGNKTVQLSDSARITGVDADEGMIDKAKSDNARPGITYEVLDMSALEPRFKPATFDAAVCLGNTLVHLTEPDTIQALCDTVRRLLKPGGLFICQILNYDRILDNAVSELPVIDTPNTRFSRFYTRRDDILLFRTELLVKASKEKLTNETPLYALRPDDLNDMLRRAGFSRQEQYGSYQGGPFCKESSFVLITVAVA